MELFKCYYVCLDVLPLVALGIGACVYLDGVLQKCFGGVAVYTISDGDVLCYLDNFRNRIYIDCLNLALTSVGLFGRVA